MVGREWVEPNQWVDVQFGVVFGPEMVGRGWGNFSGGGVVGRGGGKVTVLMADGTSRSVDASALNQVGGCGGMLSLGNETVGVIE